MSYLGERQRSTTGDIKDDNARPRSATAAPSAPWHIDSKMKGSLSSSMILNAMTQDSVADSLDRCMLVLETELKWGREGSDMQRTTAGWNRTRVRCWPRPMGGTPYQPS
ncbi:unnamed protein product [Pleuronectes platessa]|uniref:Uncharacterized protein n=1 Tax=Pleuronectes platessa TaxID=8262 RepID=A0A9N7UMD6_PLEPL|nr:unnamed protein product [Pleuronectes platessa]